MLVLTRKSAEEIVIGTVRITVVAVEQGRVRLGIEAPTDIVIRRAELPEYRKNVTRALTQCLHTPGRKGRTP